MNTSPNTNYGTAEGKKEQLVKDLKSVVADADDLVKEVAGSTAEEFAAMRTRIEGRLGAAKARLDDARIAVTNKARVAAAATDEYVKENPWKILGVAAVAGLIAGFILRRR